MGLESVAKLLGQVEEGDWVEVPKGDSKSPHHLFHLDKCYAQVIVKRPAAIGVDVSPDDAKKFGPFVIIECENNTYTSPSSVSVSVLTITSSDLF